VDNVFAIERNPQCASLTFELPSTTHFHDLLLILNEKGGIMKTATHGNEQVECYQDAELTTAEFVQTCEAVKELWRTRCREYVEQHGQRGTAVIGAGFTVWYLPPRARKPQRKMILDSPLGFQGSIVWESSRGEIEKAFTDAGIEVHYEWGSMD
jgi:hypothetical protein